MHLWRRHAASRRAAALEELDLYPVFLEYTSTGHTGQAGTYHRYSRRHTIERTREDGQDCFEECDDHSASRMSFLSTSDSVPKTACTLLPTSITPAAPSDFSRA